MPRSLLPGIRHLHAISGDKANAEKVISELKRESARRYVNAYELALIHMGLGENDQAFKSLEQALREHSDMLV